MCAKLEAHTKVKLMDPDSNAIAATGGQSLESLESVKPILDVELFSSVACKSTETIANLIERKADVNSTHGEVHFFARNKVESFFPNVKEEITPLHEACIKNRLDVVKLLVENGAEVEAREKVGFVLPTNSTEDPT